MNSYAMRCLAGGALIAAIAGCAELTARSRNYTEPDSGSLARVRFITNGGLHLIAGSSCKKWSASGAGALFATNASSPYVSRKLNLPASQTSIDPGMISGEVKVPANKPLTVVFSSLTAGAASCDYSWSFVPKADEDYEVKVWHELGGGGGGLCRFEPKSLSHPTQRVAISHAEDC